jgi:hypothetical protein
MESKVVVKDALHQQRTQSRSVSVGQHAEAQDRVRESCRNAAAGLQTVPVFKSMSAPKKHEDRPDRMIALPKLGNSSMASIALFVDKDCCDNSVYASSC